jgi:hypothetical protein
MKAYSPNPIWLSEYTIQIPNDSDLLKFDSKFECGNLRKAVRI